MVIDIDYILKKKIMLKYIVESTSLTLNVKVYVKRDEGERRLEYPLNAILLTKTTVESHNRAKHLYYHSFFFFLWLS